MVRTLDRKWGDLQSVQGPVVVWRGDTALPPVEALVQQRPGPWLSAAEASGMHISKSQGAKQFFFLVN